MFPLISLAVGLILFEGGLSLKLSELHETGTVVLRLVSLGLVASWLLAATAAWWILEFSLPMAVLLGALLTVSGPTVILPLLRHVRPAKRISSVAKWEGIVNDPIGAVLAALVFEVVAHGGLDSEHLASDSLLSLGRAVVVGVSLGVLGAWLLRYLLKHYWIPDYLQNPVFLAVILVLFAASNLLQHESGLLTVTLLGVILANQRDVAVQHVVEFKENLRVLLISTLFIVLASRVSISREMLVSVGLPTLAFVAVLIFAIRPIAAMLATFGSDLSWRERLLLCWIHPRGIVAAAVASLFALHLGSTEFAQQADAFVFVTFAVIVGTVVVYGLTLGPLANWLGLSRSNPQGVLFAGASPWVREVALALQEEGYSTLLIDTNPEKIAAARMAGLPVQLASITSELVLDAMDLGEVGRLLAVTSNDEVNSLATMEFSDEFGRAGVHQLAPPETSSERYQQVPAHRRGRNLFDEIATLVALERRHAAGDEVKRTALTDDFTYDDFLQRYGETALLLFVIDDGGQLIVNSTDEDVSPEPGQKVIALVRNVEA